MHSLPDDLNLLRDLDVLLTERHVTRAAKKLGISQSAASVRLRRLREAFGDPLLVDARPLMLLTERGLALAGPVREALVTLSESIARLDFDPRTSQRRFVIVGADLVEASAVPVLLAALAKRAPHMTLEIERPSPDLPHRLGAGKADLAFVPRFQASPSLRSMRLFEDSFVVLMREGHPAAKRALTLKTYLAHPHVLVAPTGAPGSFVDDALAKIGEARRVVAVVRHFMTAPVIVARTDALLTCPMSVAHAYAGLLPLVEAAPPIPVPPYELAAVWHDRVHHDPAHIFLRGVIRDVLASEEAPVPRRSAEARIFPNRQR
ncbi:MAG: LysR family transcriptional regulator [Myxococcales bacterium]|nr:LysR family transcriptional regulator [Myxococcales bacterium]